jgi:exonuclease III
MVTYARRTMSEALARVKELDGKKNQVGYCLLEVAEIFGLTGPYSWGGNGEAWAYNFWLSAVKKGKVVKTNDPAEIPAGAMVFHAPRPKATTNGGKAGHVAVGAGDGKEYSTDRPKDGIRGKVTIKSIEKSWKKELVGYILVTGDGITLTDRPLSTSTDRMDPAAYFIGAHGDHVTWLGQRLVLHLESLGITPPYVNGPGPDFTATDRKAVQLFQEAQGWLGDAADGFPGATTLKRLARTPEEAPIRSMSSNMTASRAHFMVKQRGLSMNCAGYDKVKGAKTSQKRAPEIGKVILKFKPTIVCLQELEIHSLDEMDAALKPGGFRRVSSGGKGREIYLGERCTELSSGLRMVRTELQDDDKPWAWAAYECEGTRCIAVSFHNENEGNSVQKQQLREVVTRALELADEHQVPYANVYVTGDGNLPSAEDDVEAWNWISGGKHAPKKTNYGLKTASKWGPKREGKPIDVDLFRLNGTIDAYFQHIDNKLSDHYLHYVDFETIGR